MSAPAVDDPPVARAPTYPIESVDNVLRLLILLTERKQVRVSEAASELGTAVSTAHRLLAMLVHRGFAEQDPESRIYRVGPVLLRTGLRAARDLDVRTLVQPFLEQLREQTAETVHAAVLQGDQVLFVACAESPNALRVASRVGSLMWAHCTSIGKAWLACESDEFLRRLYPSPRLPALTDRSITSRAALLQEIEAARREGFARNDNESEIGIGSVSAAACQRDGRPVVSISVSVPLARMPDRRWDELVAPLLETKRTVEAALP
ncbi:MAG: IclR family transcriptional regulator [Actinomycetota bacterium]|jgi:DNA-binding IclR family transcriptional regulator|nr:IclR family transcriptional regulator [Actinomycetota bacterium]